MMRGAREQVAVALDGRSYHIHIGPGLIDTLAESLPMTLAGRRAFILMDEAVAEHGARLGAQLTAADARSVESLALPAGEKTKSFVRLEQVLDWLLGHHVDRKSILFVLGGGVIGDLGGFAASVAMRGIPFVQIPTTLLAQVDSSVGGKTGINTSHGKNLVGSFYQPEAVFCDLDILKSLPARQIRAGYAEIVKYGLLGDEAFFAWLETHGADVCALEPEALGKAVAHSCRMKAEIVAEDEKEQGRRALLNLGHTFGHALEASAAYDGRLLHGEAVAIGTVLAFRLSEALGHCEAGTSDRVKRHLRTMGLQTEISHIQPALQDSADRLVELMDHDKKAEAGRPVFIVAKKIGETFIQKDVDLTIVTRIVAESLSR